MGGIAPLILYFRTNDLTGQLHAQDSLPLHSLTRRKGRPQNQSRHFALQKGVCCCTDNFCTHAYIITIVRVINIYRIVIIVFTLNLRTSCLEMS